MKFYLFPGFLIIYLKLSEKYFRIKNEKWCKIGLSCPWYQVKNISKTPKKNDDDESECHDTPRCD
jgi:hypothetical protein